MDLEDKTFKNKGYFLGDLVFVMNSAQRIYTK